MKTILKASGDRYKKLREEHGDHADHTNTIVREPVANVEDGWIKRDEYEARREHEPTTHTESLTDSEIDKDRIDDMLQRIGVFDPGANHADDLQKLNGVGPVMEQKLHQVGIYTFAQISNLTFEDYELLDRVIDNFPTPENRGDWNHQANQLKKK